MKSLSKFIALVLRHDPGAAKLTLSPEGWAKVNDLIAGCRAKGFEVTPALLAELVAADEKGRYVLSPDGQLIRATQGHSVEVNLGLEPTEPPELLFHGTIARALNGIFKEGLTKRSRRYVPLSGDRETAAKVGGRRGKPVILIIRAREMHAAGLRFYRAENGVWLVDHVPVDFIDFEEGEFRV